MKSRTQQLRDALGAPAALDEDYYDCSFKQQMEDLGVEVARKEAPKPQIIWYRPKRGRKGMGKRISLGNSYISLGHEAVKLFGGESVKLVLSIAVISEKRYIAIQVDPGGYKIWKTKSTYRVGSQAYAAWLRSQGMPVGKYKLREIKGGWLAVPEEGARR